MATPNTSLIFRDEGNGIRNVKTGVFRPFVTDSFSPGEILSVSPNRRFYVRDVVLSVASPAGDAGTSVDCTGTVDNQLRVFARVVKPTLTAYIGSQRFPVRVLCDKETSIDVAATDISSVSVTVTYAEVDDLA